MQLARQRELLLQRAEQADGELAGQKRAGDAGTRGGVLADGVHLAPQNARQGPVRFAVAARAGPARPEPHPAALGFARELRERKGERRALRSALRPSAPRLHLADVPEEHGLQNQRVRAPGLRDLRVRGVGRRPRVRRVLLRHLERRQRLRVPLRILPVLRVTGE